MKSSRILRRSGTRARSWRRAAILSVVTCLALATGCNYGFEGGGFPSHIRTIYIAPFDNETAQFEIQGVLFSALLEELPAQLGLRTAGEESADAVLRGEIIRYDDAAQNYRPGDAGAAGQVLAHEVQIGIAARIVDVRDNVIRWETQSLVGRGRYDPGAETEAIGQSEAIQSLIEQIIDGAQSQW